MNELTKFLVDGILNEDQKQTIALFGGGFKPPTKGHLDVIINGLRQNPEINKVKIIVGGGKRGDFNQIQSAKIWEIYRNANLIPVDVEIIKASPFKYYKDYLTQNPNDKVFVFIGSREGDEDDQFDVKERSEYVKKYSDNVIPVEVATTGGVSGTEARDLFQNNIKSFRNMFPDNLSDDEYNQILKILGKKDIKEGRKKKKDPKKGTGKKPKDSNRRLYTDEDPKDTVGIKFSTKQDIVDTLNKTSFKSKSHARQSQIINLIHQRVRAAYGRAKDPAVKKRLKTGLDYITKKKEASKKKTQRLKNKKLNENATYSNKIDYKQQILDLTKHMIKKGMNILPLPKVIFKHGDQENASQFLGKTAYYNPSDMVIVLYTEGRHPKDIARSFSHEMIHHIQNLENRLGGINTTNTMEDDNLNDIEREAYTKGNMTFRNWTDNKDGEEVTSLSEKKKGFDDKLGKDPFGLNQFAREVAEGVLNEGRYDRLTNQLSRAAFKVFKDAHDRGDEKGEFKFIVDHPDEEHDIPSKDFFFDFEGYVEFTDDLYFVDGGADVGLDNVGDDIQPILNVSFKIPKNPDWQKVSFDIKDVVRHELEHLTQGGGNLKPGKYVEDDQLVRDLVNAKMLPKSQYFKLEGEVDAMLQGMYFKAKKSRQPFGEILNNYLDIFINNGEITSEEKEDILKVWRSRGKALSLPLFEQTEEQMNYTIYSDMDGVLTDFDFQFMKSSEGIIPSEYKRNFGTNGFWDLIEKGGVGYWAGMPWMSDGRKYWDYIKKYTPLLLSSPSASESSRLGKRVWVKNNLPGTKLILARSTDKQKYADENSILIDDRPSNIDQWRSQGGIGILHVSAEDTIQQLKKLGL